MNAKKVNWITNETFVNLTPIDVFHKENDPYENTHPKELENKHILFRRQIILEETQNLKIRISADDYYKLYINGIFVTQGPAPGYHFHYYYNEIDVSSFLQKGENTIAVHTYYQGLINRVWVSADLRHGLYFELLQNDEPILVSDESWNCAEHTAFSVCGKIGYDTAFAECYDAGAKEVGFEKSDFNDSGWQKAHIRKNIDYTLVPQPTEELSIYDITPKSIVKTDFGYAVDLAFEAVGYITFRATGTNGEKVTIRCGEELLTDGRVRYKMRCNCDYEEFMILSGREDTLSQYDYKAFRYIELILPEGCTVDPESIKVTVRHYPYREVVSLVDQDVTLQKVFHLSADTIKYGVQECFVDCPTREKGQYLGDVSIVAMAHSILTGDAGMMRKALENYTQSSFICEGLMTVAPASLMQEIADYSLQFPMQVLWYYHFTKDIAFLRQMYPYVMNVLGYFKKYARPDGLLETVTGKWNLVDWPANLRDNYDFELTRPIGEGCHNVVNAFYCGMITHIDEILQILGEPVTGMREGLNAAFVKAFYREDMKLFCDSEVSSHPSLHSNILPLLFDVGIDAETKESIVNLVRQKRLTASGTYMAYFILSALKRVGETELMKELILDKGAWLNMLEEGATTCFEAWGKDQKWNTSLFHPWSACPVILLDTKPIYH